MSIRMNPTVRHLKPTTLRDPSRDFSSISYCDFLVVRFKASSSSLASRPLVRSRKFDESVGRIAALNAWGREGSLQELDDSPVSVELSPISSESQFGRVIAEAQQLEESVIVVWYVSGFFGVGFKLYWKVQSEGLDVTYFGMVKLEFDIGMKALSFVDGKLVQEMYILETKVGKIGSRLLSELVGNTNEALFCFSSRLRFYCVDVNAVPHRLVAHAGVTKMPTIQLWKDGKKQAEVIGGHKAYLVVNEVRTMIENESAL
ncbi:hypothetical protein FNV43_RR25105 [Rhamnella rubrinervis]|uniref:Thioredoxin domain-containing protein n=1 Tax=Rhamnella rubrinervis TaxID=2594499 RepID=A0A8K0DZE2_9ROSA|nr:hypothetical protein FNV43_RR25105 [Rhamnella rubrinervis]